MPTLQELGAKNLTEAAKKLGMSLGELLAKNPGIKNPNMVSDKLNVNTHGKVSKAESERNLNRVFYDSEGKPQPLYGGGFAGGRTPAPEPSAVPASTIDRMQSSAIEQAGGRDYRTPLMPSPPTTTQALGPGHNFGDITPATGGEGLLDQSQFSKLLSESAKTKAMGVGSAQSMKLGAQLYASVQTNPDGTMYVNDRGEPVMGITNHDTGVKLYWDPTVPGGGSLTIRKTSIPALAGMVRTLDRGVSMPVLGLAPDEVKLLQMRGKIQENVNSLEQASAANQQNIDQLKQQILTLSHQGASTQEEAVLLDILDVRQARQTQYEGAKEDVSQIIRPDPAAEEAIRVTGLQGTPVLVPKDMGGPLFSIMYFMNYITDVPKGWGAANQRRHPWLATLGQAVGGIGATIGWTVGALTDSVNATLSLWRATDPLTRNQLDPGWLNSSTHMTMWQSRMAVAWEQTSMYFQAALNGTKVPDQFDLSVSDIHDPQLQNVYSLEGEIYDMISTSGVPDQLMYMSLADSYLNGGDMSSGQRLVQKLEANSQYAGADEIAQKLGNIFDVKAARQRDIEYTIGMAQRLLLAGQKDEALLEARKAIRLQVDQANYLDPTAAYTWTIQPERKEMFSNALAEMVLQKGKPLTRQEIWTVKQLFINPGYEATGELVQDFVLILPNKAWQMVMEPIIGALKFTLGLGPKLAIKGGRWVANTDVPVVSAMGRTVRWLTSQAHRSVAASIEQGMADASRAVAQNVTTTIGDDSLKDAMTWAGRAAQGDPEAVQHLPVMGFRNTLNLDRAAQMTRGIKIGELRPEYQPLVRLVQPENWGDLVVQSYDDVYQLFLEKETLRLKPLVAAGELTQEEANKQAIAFATTIANDPRRVSRQVGITFHTAYLAIHTPRLVSPASNVLDDSITYNIVKAFGDEAVKKVYGQSSDVASVGRLFNWGRRNWTQLLLSDRPGWSWINLIDSYTRYIIEGGDAIFSDMGFILNTYYARALESGNAPEALMQTFMRQGLEEGEGVASKLASGWRPMDEGLPGPLGFILAEWRRLGAKNSTLIAEGGKSEAANIAVKVWRTLGKGHAAWGGGWTDFNASIEFTLRLRLFAKKFAGNIEMIDGIEHAAWIKAIDESSMSTTEKIMLRDAWRYAGDRPEKLSSLMKSLQGEHKIWTVYTPSDMDQLLKNLTPEERTNVVRSIVSHLDEVYEFADKRGTDVTTKEINNLFAKIKESIIANRDQVQKETGRFDFRHIKIDASNKPNLDAELSFGAVEVQTVKAPERALEELASREKTLQETHIQNITDAAKPVADVAVDVNKDALVTLTYTEHGRPVIVLGGPALDAGEKKINREVTKAVSEILVRKDKPLIEASKGFESLEAYRQALRDFLRNPNEFRKVNGGAYGFIARQMEASPTEAKLLEAISSNKKLKYSDLLPAGATPLEDVTTEAGQILNNLRKEDMTGFHGVQVTPKPSYYQAGERQATSFGTLRSLEMSLRGGTADPHVMEAWSAAADTLENLTNMSHRFQRFALDTWPGPLSRQFGVARKRMWDLYYDTMTQMYDAMSGMAQETIDLVRAGRASEVKSTSPAELLQRMGFEMKPGVGRIRTPAGKGTGYLVHLSHLQDAFRVTTWDDLWRPWHEIIGLTQRGDVAFSVKAEQEAIIKRLQQVAAKAEATVAEGAATETPAAAKIVEAIPQDPMIDHNIENTLQQAFEASGLSREEASLEVKTLSNKAQIWANTTGRSTTEFYATYMPKLVDGSMELADRATYESFLSAYDDYYKAGKFVGGSLASDTERVALYFKNGIEKNMSAHELYVQAEADLKQVLNSQAKRLGIPNVEDYVNQLVHGAGGTEDVWKNLYDKPLPDYLAKIGPDTPVNVSPISASEHLLNSNVDDMPPVLQRAVKEDIQYFKADLVEQKPGQQVWIRNEQGDLVQIVGQKSTNTESYLKIYYGDKTLGIAGDNKADLPGRIITSLDNILAGKPPKTALDRKVRKVLEWRLGNVDYSPFSGQLPDRVDWWIASGQLTKAEAAVKELGYESLADYNQKVLGGTASLAVSTEAYNAERMVLEMTVNEMPNKQLAEAVKLEARNMIKDIHEGAIDNGLNWTNQIISKDPEEIIIALEHVINGTRPAGDASTYEEVVKALQGNLKQGAIDTFEWKRPANPVYAEAAKANPVVISRQMDISNAHPTSPEDMLAYLKEHTIHGPEYKATAEEMWKAFVQAHNLEIWGDSRVASYDRFRAFLTTYIKGLEKRGYTKEAPEALDNLNLLLQKIDNYQSLKETYAEFLGMEPKGYRPSMKATPIPYPEWALSDYTRTWIESQRSNLAKVENVLSALDKWETYLTNMIKNDSAFLRKLENPELVQNALQDAIERKTRMVDAAIYGDHMGFYPSLRRGPLGVSDWRYGHAGMPGALEVVNHTMLDYTNYGHITEALRTFVPFIMFVERSIPYWLETLALHPEIAAFYETYMSYTRRLALQEGAVTSSGEPLPSRNGYIPIPGTKLFFNPTAPLSLRFIFAQETSYQDDVNTANMPIFSRVLLSLNNMSRYYGFNTGPWVVGPANWLDKASGGFAQGEITHRSIVPELDLIPMWAQRALLNSLRRMTNIDMPDTWTPQVPWEDYLVEVDMLSNVTAQIASDKLTEDQKWDLVNEVRSALGYKEQADFTRFPLGYSQIPRTDSKLWLEARARVEKADWVSSVTGFFTGIYPKKYSDGRETLIAIRNQINTLRDQINNEMQADLFGSYPDAEHAYNAYVQQKYQTPEGWLSNLYGSLSWTQTPTGDQALGDQRRQIILQRIHEDIVTNEFYTHMDTLSTQRDESLKKVAVGNLTARSAIWEQYFISVSQLEDNPLYTDANKSWTVGYKPNSMIEDTFRQRWYSYLYSTRPRMSSGENYNDYQARYNQWLDELPKIAEAERAAFLNDKVFPALFGESPRRIISPESSLEAKIPADRIVNVKALIDSLVKETSKGGLDQWKMDMDTVYDALDNGWKNLVWDPYWAGPGSISGNQFAREQASQEYLAKFDKPTMDQLMAWVEQNYPGRWSADQITQAAQGGIYTVNERLAPDTEIAKKEDALWNVLLSAGPKTAALYKEMDRIQQYASENWNTWINSNGHASAWADPAEFDNFYKVALEAARNLDLSTPTSAQLLEWSKVKDLQSGFNKKVEVTFGKDFVHSVMTPYWNLNAIFDKKERDALKAADPRIEQYSEVQKQYAIDNPAWAKYYAPWLYQDIQDGKLTSAGAVSGGRGFQSRGAFKTVKQPSSGGGISAGGDTSATGMYLPLAYRSVAPEALAYGTIGKGNVAGKPYWPPGFPETVGNIAIDKIQALIEDSQPLDSRMISFLTDLKGRHPEWGDYIDGVISLSNEITP